jgi:hypothetical protein
MTLITDFPSTVARKNVWKEIKKWPHRIPAKSKRGLGMEANSVIVTKAYFLRFL